MGPCQRSDTLNGFVTDQPSRVSCRNPASPRLWDDLPQVQWEPRGMPSPGSSLIFQLWDAATVKFMHAKRREHTLHSLSSSPTHSFQISAWKKKFWVELLIFLEHGEVTTAWTLCLASREYKRSPKQKRRGSVYLDEPAPQSDLVCMSGSFWGRRCVASPRRWDLRDETSLRRNEDGRGWIFKKISAEFIRTLLP